jgi:uncharacterized protein YndB with AHSA1/START domain
MASIKQLFHINAEQEKVYQAITTVDGLSKWWTAQTSGDASMNGTIEFRFGEHVMAMKVVEMRPNEYLKWQCVKGADEWIGTILAFALDRNENKTRVRFEHAGWQDTGDFFAQCSFSWGRYMESLRQLCETGKGQAFGSNAN